MAPSFLRRWVGSLTEEAKLEVEAVLFKVTLYAVAGLAGLGVVILLALALYWFLEARLGSMAAALIEAGIFAVIGAAFAIWASQPRETIKAGTTEQVSSSEPAGNGSRHPPGAVSDTMGVDLDDVGRTLASAGYRLEGLVVMASSEFARQLSPLQFVSLVFVASFLFGRRLRRA